jgi:hypothetical protein
MTWLNYMPTSFAYTNHVPWPNDVSIVWVGLGRRHYV